MFLGEMLMAIDFEGDELGEVSKCIVSQVQSVNRYTCGRVRRVSNGSSISRGAVYDALAELGLRVDKNLSFGRQVDGTE